jgi:hypothetical protein
MLDTDPTKPTEELLRNIRNAANQPHYPGLPLIGFATLLVKISQEASATADKNMIIQRRMILITVVILCISITQLLLAFIQFFSGNPTDTQRIVAPQTRQIEEYKKDVVVNDKVLQSTDALAK